MVLGGFALVAIMPVILLVLFFAAVCGLEDDIQDLFNSFSKK
tara:strand:+ start:531 stop:656 length:126 start_codon:yes stop_codon:yes gene_type:complete